MKIDRDEVARIAALAALELDEEALERMTADLTSILDYVDKLASVAEASEAAHAGADPPPLRPDIVHPPQEHELIARNAPSFADGSFVVPAVIGGGKK
jgi:aspartyl-tRNA(Asn)/glutamyl-tRNA(Gln) amidotransferase subunit C